MIIYTTVLPNGKTYTHATRRTYTHAIASYNPNTDIWYVNAHCGSQVLAEKRLKQLTNFYKQDFVLLKLEVTK
jgi:hypothetical protein